MDRSLLYLIFCIFILTGFFLFVSAPGAAELKLIRDEEIRAGEGEICHSPTFKLSCQEGLECVKIEKTYYINGYCINTSE